MYSHSLGTALLCAAAWAAAAETVIEEIVVTAHKRPQPIESVAVAVTAFSNATIRELGWNTAAEVQQQTPNLYIKESFNQVNPTLYLRGVGINDFNANVSSAVGIYVDEAYIGSPSALLFPLFDLERIEVLAGPQGTLFGRNTTAGLIHYVSRKPSADPTAELRLSHGRFDEWRLDGAAGGRLSDTVQARVALNVRRRDGVGENLLTGNDINEIEYWAARAQLAWQPASSTELLLRLEAADSDAPARQYKSRGLIMGADVFGYRDDPDPDVGLHNREGPEEVRVDSASLRFTHRGEAVEFTSLSSWQQVDRFSDENSDASPAQLLELTASNDSEHFSQEFRWQGLLAGDGHWTAGVYYYDERLDAETTFDLLRDLRPQFGFDPTLGIFFARHQYRQETSSLAAFGHADVPIGQAWMLSAGLRYTHEERDFVSDAFFDEPFGRFPILNVDNETDFGSWSGRLAAEYRPDDRGVAYVSVSRGFKSGGFNGGLAFTPREAEPFDEETLTAYEVGFKRSFGSRVRFGGAAFYYDYSDLQVFTIVNTGGVPISVLDNAADAEVVGLEAWADARPTQRLKLRLGLGLLDTETTRFVTDLGEDFTGNELANAPNLTFNALLGYDWPVAGGTLTAQVDTRYLGEFFFDTANSTRLEGGDYWHANARLAWRSGDGRWGIALWGRNVFDKRYLVNAFDVSDFGFDQLRWSDPATYGITLSWALE